MSQGPLTHRVTERAQPPANSEAPKSRLGTVNSLGGGTLAGLRVAHLSKNVIIAGMDRTIVGVSREELPIAAAQALSELSGRIIRQHGSVNLLGVIEAGRFDVSSEARQELTAWAARDTSHIAGAAIVYEGTGFGATAVRSIITAVHIASRGRHPLKVCAALQDALNWLAEQQGDRPFNRAALGAAVLHLRGRGR